MNQNASKKQRNRLSLMGRKKGMLQLYDDKGIAVACTLVEVDPSVVVQVKTEEQDGYEALQLGYQKIQVKDSRTLEKRVSKPQMNHFKKASLDPHKYLYEARVQSIDSYEVGQKLGIEQFEKESYLDVTAQSKGKGFQGVMKKFNFSGGPGSHGSGFHRRAGSTGMRSTPGRCLPGSPRASQMGNQQVTVEGLKILKIFPEKNAIAISGSIPGPTNAVVKLRQSVKKN